MCPSCSLDSIFRQCQSQLFLNSRLYRKPSFLVWYLCEWYTGYGYIQVLKECKRQRILKWESLLVWTSENFQYLQMWYQRSPPVNRSIMRYRFSLSWNANCIFTMWLHLRALTYCSVLRASFIHWARTRYFSWPQFSVLTFLSWRTLRSLICFGLSRLNQTLLCR